MSSDVKLGELLKFPQSRDAIHVAVYPVVADKTLQPGQHIGLIDNERASDTVKTLGIVDPFLKTAVKKDERFWMFLYPNTVTSMRHHWNHPNFPDTDNTSDAEFSRKWMIDWVIRNMPKGYYDDDEKEYTEQEALDVGIRCGHTLCVGPHESAREHIDSEWWGHWERITGCNGNREGYFSCSC